MLTKIILFIIVSVLVVFSFRQGFKIGAKEGIKRGALVISCQPAFNKVVGTNEL